ncbi:hypothetical protein ABMA28_015961 [Loxostege sticticalis]|uniref:FP protein C-terminal domain-containing protein n=1 Tax=Loxostege sticticalis TaxID=481309 RepID=A0ABD0TDB2_LOXSC
MNKSLSDSNLTDETNTTPPNYISIRNKRKRDEDLHTEFENFERKIELMFNKLSTTKDNEISKISQTLTDIQNTNQNIEASIAFLVSQNEDLKKKVDSLEIQNKKDKEYITILEDKLEEVQRSSRKSSVEIKNVPKNPNETNETLINYVCTLASKIDINMTSSDIGDIYRLKSNKPGKNNSSIVVETRATLLKQEFIKKSKLFNIKNKEKLRAKHLGFKTNEETPIYVSEHLTIKGSRLFFLARDLAKTKNYKFCWTSFGRVYVRKSEDSRIIAITNEAQIQNLMQAI